MELKQSFEQVMSESINMALATSVNDQPNVRTVTFAYTPEKEGRLFFTTFKGNQKTREFAQNARVACFPLPVGPEADTQVRIFGEVRKSDISIDEVIDIIGKKFSGGTDTIKDGGDMMEVYEVRFSQAHVTICMNDAQTITF